MSTLFHETVKMNAIYIIECYQVKEKVFKKKGVDKISKQAWILSD